MKAIYPLIAAGVFLAALIYVIARPEFATSLHVRLGLRTPGESHIQSMRIFHSRMDSSNPDGAAIFLGDSITQGMPVTAVANRAVNYGIGYQTSIQLLESMQIYASLKRASVIFLNIGTNDVRDGRGSSLPSQFEKILAALPEETPLVWSAIVPRDSASAATIRAANTAAEALCKARPRCEFVDTWEFLAERDGSGISQHYDNTVHPNASGYALWVPRLRDATERLR